MSRRAGGDWRGIAGAAILLLGLMAGNRRGWGEPSALDEARTLTRTGHLDDAVVAYTRVLEVHPDDLAARKERARVLCWLHRDADALPDYDRVLQTTPRDTEAAVARARALARLERVDEAEQALRGAIAAHPRGADAHLALAAVLLQRGRVEEATASFTRARALAPGDPVPLVGLARARAAAGDTAGATAARQDALAAYDRLLVRDPDDRDARVGRAQLLVMLGRDADALADYDRVLASSPRDVEAVLGRVPILLRHDRLDEAAAAAQTAVALDPRSADAWVALGEVQTRQQRLEDATQAYGEARALSPNAVEPVLGLARLRLRQDDRPGARAVYAEALQLDPRNQDAVDALNRIARSEEAPPPHMFRLYLTGRYDALTENRSDWWQGTVVLGVRPRPGTSFFLGLDQYHRNDQDDTQLSVGAGQALPGDFTLSGSFAYGFDAEVIAQEIYEAEVTRPLAPWITPSLRFRWSDFTGGIYTASLSPGVELNWQSYAALLLRYYFTHSSDAGDGHAGSARLSLFPEDRWSFYGAIGYGRETYLANTIENAVSGLDVLTLGAGVVWHVRDALGIRLDYEYEDRRGSYSKHGVGVGVIVDF